MALSDRVHIARRFQRAIRIDTDLADPAALEGFICPPSSADILKTMARHVAEKRSGRLYLDRSLWQRQVELGRGVQCSPERGRRSQVLRGISPRREVRLILSGMRCRPATKGWRILPVVGRRDRPAQVIGEAMRGGWAFDR